MKKFMPLLVSVSLICAMLITLAGCTKNNLMSEDIEPKIEQMLDYISAGDEEGAYSMMYPGEVPEEAFLDNFEIIRNSFPVPEEHTLSRNTFRSVTGLGTEVVKEFIGEYYIAAADQRLRLTVEWKETKSEKGFVSFNIIKEMDLAFTGEDR